MAELLLTLRSFLPVHKLIIQNLGLLSDRKVKYFHSTIKTAEDRRQKFHFSVCRLP